MRKDYIESTDHGVGETEFVENYWTLVWEQEGGVRSQIGRIQRKDEYRIMAPYMSRLSSGSRVLDGGCGLGDWTLRFTSEGYSVVGLDLSRKTVERLQERFPEATFADGDIRHMDFPDASFDAYFSWGVFEHFEAGPQECVREAFRVLKPDGLLFISVPFDNLRHSLLGSFSSPRAISKGNRFYQWRFTRAELARELAIGGFVVLDVKPIHKRQGVLRCLHHEFGMPINWLVTRGLSAALSPLLPSALVAHMILAVARKTGGSEQRRG